MIIFMGNVIALLSSIFMFESVHPKTKKSTNTLLCVLITGIGLYFNNQGFLGLILIVVSLKYIMALLKFKTYNIYNYSLI